MAHKQIKAQPHPDDFIAVTVSLDFRVKLNPKAIDPIPLDTRLGWRFTEFPPKAMIVIEQMLEAIRAKRLYGFMMQESAKTPIASKEWIEKTLEEVLAQGMSDADLTRA